MSTKEKILSLLEENKGAPVSGAEMANKTGVSRTAVWKAISDLRADGYTVDAVTHGGYTLTQNCDRLSVQSIEKHLATKGLSLRVEKAVDSTNTQMKAAAKSGATEGTVLIAEEQSAGRGRSGKNFVSPNGCGIYMSILLRPCLAVSDALLITTCAAVSVAKAIEKCTGKPTRIKWVNDVFQSGKKVCGILTEGEFDMESGKLDSAILGIGINVFEPKGGFPEEIRDIAGALFEYGAGDKRSKLAADIIDNFFALYPTIEQRTYFDDYAGRSMLDGQKIHILRGGKDIAATALGVDRDFRLRIRNSDGTEEYLSTGEVSVKPYM